MHAAAVAGSGTATRRHRDASLRQLGTALPHVLQSLLNQLVYCSFVSSCKLVQAQGLLLVASLLLLGGHTTYLTLKVIFNSSFCGLLSTTSSDVVWVDKNADSSCTQKAGKTSDALQLELNGGAYEVDPDSADGAKLAACLPAPAART